MNNNNALAQIRLLVAQQHPNWTNQQVVNFVNDRNIVFDVWNSVKNNEQLNIQIQKKKYSTLQ